MNYPVWEIPQIGGGMMIGLIAILMIQRRLVAGTVAILGTVALMVVIRDRLRVAYLATQFEPSQLGVQPQPVVFALFVLIMLLGVATIAWMAWKLAQPPTSEAR